MAGNPVTRKNYPEDWLIFITTDHGRDEQTGKNHGGQSYRQRSTWMVTNDHDLNNYAQYYYPAIVDITPSILRFMNIQLPVEQLREIDGTSLIGKLSVAQPHAAYIQGYLDVSWKALSEKGNVKILIATSNNFKEGKADNYQLMAEVPVGQEHLLIDVKNTPSLFYKVVIAGEYNMINRWVVLSDKK